jgi:hypothetical protein
MVPNSATTLDKNFRPQRKNLPTIESWCNIQWLYDSQQIIDLGYSRVEMQVVPTHARKGKHFNQE